MRWVTRSDRGPEASYVSRSNIEAKRDRCQKRLWYALREAKFRWRFLRQHPIGRYIADFACPQRKLVVELDGGQHAERVEQDAVRTEELAQHGYRVIRFWNNEVLTNTEGVLMVIWRELEAPPTSPRPSPPPGAEREVS